MLRVVILDEVMLLATGQDGLITRRQATGCGMSPAAIRHAIGPGGRWQRVAPGIYATFTGPLTPLHRARAALLHGGPDAMVTGAHACRAYGMRYLPEDAPLICLLPARVQVTPMPFAQFRRTRVLPAPRTIGGIAVAPPVRAALDACRGQRSLRGVRAVLCEAVQLGLTTPGQLITALGGARWASSGLVRLALHDVDAGCRSAPECELRDVLRTSLVLDEPLWNRPLTDAGLEPLVPDACWAEARVVVEIDSAEWHRLGDRVERTERRRARYAAQGWVVLPVSPRRLRQEPTAVLAEIEAAVIAGRRRHAR